MRSKPLSLFLYVLLFSVVVGVVMLLTLSAFNIPFHGLLLVELAYFAGVTFLLLRWQEASLITDPKGFVRRFMTGLVVKMLASLMIVLILAFTAPKHLAIPFVLTFAGLYLAFLVFSVARLTFLSRKPRKA